MNNTFSSTFLTNPLKSLVVFLCTIITVKYLWRRRYLYYHSYLLPGPFSVPLIGSPSIVFAGSKGFFRNYLKLTVQYSTTWRFWAGSDLYISPYKPEEVEFLLTNCLQKDNIPFYKHANELFNSILVAPEHKWKPHRKNLNPSFNLRVIDTFFGIFVKYADRLALELGKHCGGEQTDLLLTVWNTTFNTAFETLGRVDPKTLPHDNFKFLPLIVKTEEFVMDRAVNVWYHINLFLKKSRIYQEVSAFRRDIKSQMRETIDRYLRSPPKNRDALTQKSFLNRLQQIKYNSEEMEEEITFMFFAGSETTAVVVCSVLLIMSIYPEIQKKLQDEQQSVLNHQTEEITLNHLNKFDYLRRVIKETMRVLTPIPFIARYIHKTVQKNGQVYPEGSTIIVPIWLIYRNPEYWPDPLKFDPDRFLPEEVKKRPQCAYLPFSHGPRNCIGFRYGMMAMEVLLSKLVREFEVLPGQYKCLEEIEMDIHAFAKPKLGYPIRLRRRERH